MIKWKIFSFVFFLVSTTSSFAQEIPTGTWRNHFSYQSALLVTGDNELLFCATQNGIFSVKDEGITFLSKIDGLSSTGASALKYDVGRNVLVIGYSNGSIDLVFEDKVESINDFALANLGVAKSINDISIMDQFAYLATDFGLAVLDLELLEIRQLFRGLGSLGQDITLRDVSIISNTLFVTSEDFILVGDLNKNLLDFNNWERITVSDPIGFAFFDNRLFFIEGDAFMSLNSTSLEVLKVADLPNNELTKSITTDNENVYILQESSLITWNTDQFEVVENLEDASDLLTTINGIWIADASNGLLRVDEAGVEKLIPNGPVSDAISHIKFEKDLYAFYATSPGATELNSLGYSVFTDGQWSNNKIDGFNNISDVAGFDGTVYLSSNGKGLFNLTGNEFIGSPIDNDAIISSLFADNSGLYALGYDQPEAIYQYQDDVWSSYSVNEIGTAFGISMNISRGGTAWIRKRNDGVVAFNLDDRLSRSIGTLDNLPSDDVLSVAIDRGDVLWLGTSMGPVIFTDATFVFDEFDAIVPTFENAPLLEGQKISAISIDGGNRKWVGTEDNGIWVFDENINSLDERFTSEDSPLPSNSIQEFAYNGDTGEMFILTSLGLTSYQTGTSEGGFTHGNVKIFPNPVLPDYQGVITITGLAENVNLKITDINGRLVDEINAIGGTATWDLLTAQNQAIVGSIYLFFSSSFNGEETFIGKIAVIR